MFVMQPESPEACLTVLIGGSVGGIICDIDLGSGRKTLKVKQTAGITGALMIACLVMNWVLHAVPLRCVCGGTYQSFAAALFCLALLCAWGMKQPHRCGTHSLLAIALFGGCVEVMCSAMTIPFVIAMVSHIALDLLNCKPVRLLYPLPFGWCLGICRANGRLNRWLRDLGILGTIFEIGISIGRIC